MPWYDSYETPVRENYVNDGRLESFGPAALNDSELVGVLFGGGDSLSLAERLLRQAGSLARLLAWRESDFQQIKGIGRAKARQLIAALEVGRRALARETQTEPILNTPEQVYTYMRPLTVGLDVEKLFVLCLNRKNRLMKRVELTSGSADSTICNPRDILRAALREGAVAIVLVHNHASSGDPSPSSADVSVTKAVSLAARSLEIPLADHVIVGEQSRDPSGRGYYSFKSAGLL
jgi:DNA repair protein RadC